MKIIECPVCGTDKNSSGQYLGDLRSLSLHVAGSARYGRDSKHRNWVKSLLPDTNVGSYTINEIDTHIRSYVWDALRELEVEDPPWEEEEENRDVEEIEEVEEKESYIRAYACFWEIETKLHRFAAHVLAAKHGENWWKAFPLQLQHDCVDRAQQDSHRLPLGSYIDFLDLRDVIKHDNNKQYFQEAFGSLESEYRDPQSEFHSKLSRVNQIRNNIMHPLKQLMPSDEDIATLEQFLEFVRKFTSADV